MTKHALEPTLLDEDRVGKISMRETAFNYAKHMVDNSPKSRFKMLTLPSTAWEFEKDILEYAHNVNKTIVLHACEYDYEIFSKIRTSFNKPEGIVKRFVKNSGLHWRTSSKLYEHPVIVHSVDVFTYLEQTKDMFDFIWLDLMSPVDAMHNKVIHASNRLCEAGTLILSFTKGREKEKPDDRVKYICDALPDMIYIDHIEYCDTSPMLNIIFKKKLTLEGLESTTYLGPEIIQTTNQNNKMKVAKKISDKIILERAEALYKVLEVLHTKDGKKMPKEDFMKLLKKNTNANQTYHSLVKANIISSSRISQTKTSIVHYSGLAPNMVACKKIVEDVIEKGRKWNEDFQKRHGDKKGVTKDAATVTTQHSTTTTIVDKEPAKLAPLHYNSFLKEIAVLKERYALTVPNAHIEISVRVSSNIIV